MFDPWTHPQLGLNQKRGELAVEEVCCCCGDLEPVGVTKEMVCVVGDDNFFVGDFVLLEAVGQVDRLDKFNVAVVVAVDE